MMWYETVPAEGKNRRGGHRSFFDGKCFNSTHNKSWRGKGAGDHPFAHAPPSSAGPVMRAGVRSAVVKQATMVLDDV